MIIVSLERTPSSCFPFVDKVLEDKHPRFEGVSFLNLEYMLYRTTSSTIRGVPLLHLD